MFSKSLLFVLVLMFLNANSLAIESPRHNIKAVQNKTLIVKKVYIYTSLEYEKGQEVDIDLKELNLTSPETALSSILSAMASGSINRVLMCYDEESKQRIDEMINNEVVLTKLLDQWESTYKDSKVYFSRWIDTDKPIIMEYKVQRQNGFEDINTINFIRVDGGWKATNKYSNYPVSVYLDEDVVELHGQ